MPVLDINKLACDVFDIEANAILRLKDNLSHSFDDAIDLLYYSKGKVIITGMGKSGLIGKKIAATLTSTGTPSYFLHPAESTHGDSGIITRDDVVIAISNSGETQELLNLLPLIKRFGVPIISMTGNLNSTLAKAGNVVLDISVEKEACPLGKAPTASSCNGRCISCLPVEKTRIYGRRFPCLSSWRSFRQRYQIPCPRFDAKRKLTYCI